MIQHISLRMVSLLALVIVSAVVTGCRTEIKPALMADNAPTKRVRLSTDCDVRDYPSGTDVPTGSKNIGWVEVEREGDDDATFLKLRTKVCNMGGDAISSITWERKSGDDRPSVLRANAWSLP